MSKFVRLLICSALYCRMNTNVDLYRSLRSVVEHGDKLSSEPYDETDKRVAKLFLNDFEQCGIHLDSDKVSSIIFMFIL